jgi:hypothetical protein
MGSSVARLWGGTGAPEQEEPRLDAVELAALAFRESTLGGRTYLEAYGVDVDGDVVVLAPRRPGRGTADERARLFDSLLARGLSAHVPVLVDVAGCSLLQSRVRAAWGARAVLIDDIAARDRGSGGRSH